MKLRLTWLLSLVAMLPACEVASEEGVPEAVFPEGDDAAIVGGDTYLGHPSVVFVQGYKPDPTNPGYVLLNNCTGAIISPHVVLTAAHCVHPDDVGTPTFSIIPQPNVHAPAVERLAVSRVYYHTGYVPKKYSEGHDIGVLILAKPTTLPPLPYNRAAPTPAWRGAETRFVGYGLTAVGKNDGGVKRSVITQLADYNPYFFEHNNPNQTTCQGDSGGPGLVKLNGVETIVGVTSYGMTYQRRAATPCGHETFITRTDVDIAFIDSAVKTHDPGFALPALRAPVMPGGGTLVAPTTGTALTATDARRIATGQVARYRVPNVRAGSAFTATMTGQGPIDLYVRIGEMPTWTQFHCRLNIVGANERCEVKVLAGQAQTMHLAVVGNGQFTVRADWME